jgi:hypothetical protein
VLLLPLCQLLELSNPSRTSSFSDLSVLSRFM